MYISVLDLGQIHFTQASSFSPPTYLPYQSGGFCEKLFTANPSPVAPVGKSVGKKACCVSLNLPNPNSDVQGNLN